MRDDEARSALVQELMRLTPGAEVRLSYADFELLFPPETHGPRSVAIREGSWLFDLAQDHGCSIRDDERRQVIVIMKNVDGPAESPSRCEPNEPSGGCSEANDEPGLG